VVRTFLFAACVVLCFLTEVTIGKSSELEVSAGSQDRVAVPVFFELPKSWIKAPSLVLTEIESGSGLPVQVLPGKPLHIAWIVRDLPAGQTRSYRLEPAKTPLSAGAAVTCTDDGTRLNLSIGDRPVVTYNHGLLPAPEGIDPVYAKNGHIHPMRTPSGRLVTDDFPPDHAHQHGIFFAWVNTTFEDRRVDFWNQAKKLGSVEHVKILEKVSGPVFGQFKVKLRHSDLTAPGKPKPVLEEIWTVRVYNVPDPFLSDLKSEQRCVADTPLVVNEYHYGGMGLRAAREWYKQEGSGFLTSTGKTREEGNHTRARWVITHGRSEGQPAAVAILGHPDNFRAPQYVRLHPSKPYFCFAPMVMGSFEIAPDKPYVSQYRYATYDGDPDPGLTDQLWQDFAEPPVVKMVVR
jgi:hypothetical protein